jgi:hypothetical protein
MHDGVAVGILYDLKEAFDSAARARDDDGADALRRIFFEHFQLDLGKRRAAELVDYLESRSVWREHEGWLIFKTIDQPCLAYAAQKSPQGAVTLTAIGVCYRYPNGREDTWWSDVIKPRVQRL